MKSSYIQNWKIGSVHKCYFELTLVKNFILLKLTDVSTACPILYLIRLASSVPDRDYCELTLLMQKKMKDPHVMLHQWVV